MKMVAMSAENLIGNFMYAVEEGTMVDEQTVSSVIKPDVDPIDNWESLGSIQNAGFGRIEIDDVWHDPLPGGGFRQIQRKWTVGDYLDFQSRQMNEYVHRLRMGLRTKIVQGTAQAPHSMFDRYIRVWLRVQERQLGGTDLALLDWWCDLRLSADTKWDGPKVAMPTLRAYLLAPVAGNSTVFPV